jgi:hypothetical protein
VSERHVHWQVRLELEPERLAEEFALKRGLGITANAFRIFVGVLFAQWAALDVVVFPAQPHKLGVRNPAGLCAV